MGRGGLLMKGGRGGVGVTTTLYQTVPNTEQNTEPEAKTDPAIALSSALRPTSQDMKPILRGGKLPVVSPTHYIIASSVCSSRA